jgi:transposase
MNYEALFAENLELKATILQLQFQLAQLQKLIFGAKSERFVPTTSDVNQLNLFGDIPVDDTITELEKQIITYDRKTPKKHEGRNEIPDHLPVEVVIIEPQEDTSGMVKIGDEETITLEYTKASLVKKITRRPKYARPNGEGIVIADLPSRPIDKCIAEASLLSHIIISKFVDHLPFYRQIQMFKRDFDWTLSDSTINDWFAACCKLLEPLYQQMRKQALQGAYLQVDESPIKVLDSDKPSGTHQGYQWVYHSPSERIVFFDYRNGRGAHGPKETLGDYKGYLQNDGYTVYDKIGEHPDISLVGCWAHARRYFHEAIHNDRKRAEHVLQRIGEIYEIERTIKEYNHDARKTYRIENTKPLMEEIKSYIEDQSVIVQPKSAIGKAMTYIVNQWPKLINVLDHGILQIDNNLIENKIRPLALGRKNYLFAGSHQGARRIAMIYTFMATCKANDINPGAWLEDTLQKINDTSIQDLHTLIPGYSNT